MPSTQFTTADPAARKGDAITPNALWRKLVPEPMAEMMHSTPAIPAAPPSSQIPVLVKNRFIDRFLSAQQGDAELRQHPAQQQHRQPHQQQRQQKNRSQQPYRNFTKNNGPHRNSSK